MDQIIEVLQQGEKDKLMPPRFLLEKAVEQCKSIADPVGDANPFAKPLSHFPDAVAPADRTRLKTAIVGAIDHDARPTETHSTAMTSSNKQQQRWTRRRSTSLA